MNWRHLLGAALMILGGAVAAAMMVLAILVTANLVHWSNSGETLRTVAAVTVPSALFGLALIVLGRWAYGDWNGAAPVRQASSLTVRLAGFLIAIGLGVMLLFLLATGLAPDDQNAAIVLGLGTAIGVMLVMFGLRMKPRGRRYLDD